MLAVLLATAAGGSFLVLVAGRRRRPDPVEGPAAVTVTTPIVPVQSSLAHVESQVPRWLRPSVRAARFESDHVKVPRPVRQRQAFATPAEEAAERLLVRFDLVQLLDRPDEALGIPLGELDAGDEVEVLERDDIWARVSTPAGRAGWVPALTLASADAFAARPDPGRSDPKTDRAEPEADAPALETLLASAAQRRAARPDAQQASRSTRPKKLRKSSRRGSSRVDVPD